MTPVLTIAGTDPTGGAGALADLRAMTAAGAYGMCAVAAVTVQNTVEVRDTMPVPVDIVTGQIEAVFDDMPPLAVKSGMLCNAAVVTAVARALERRLGAVPYVCDPVMVSTSGFHLLDDTAVEAVVTLLFPLATLITPNRHEAFRLTGVEDPLHQIDLLRQMGARNILVKGGDSARRDVKIDYLALEGREPVKLVGEAVDTRNTHGTGCTLSAFIAARLAQGVALEQAVSQAKDFVGRSLRRGASVKAGHGHGPCFIE